MYDICICIYIYMIYVMSYIFCYMYMYDLYIFKGILMPTLQPFLMHFLPLGRGAFALDHHGPFSGHRRGTRQYHGTAHSLLVRVARWYLEHVGHVVGGSPKFVPPCTYYGFFLGRVWVI